MKKTELKNKNVMIFNYMLTASNFISQL